MIKLGIALLLDTAGRDGWMLVRYYVADEPAVLRDASNVERDVRCRRIEAFSTVSGGLILLTMLATLMIVQG